MSESGSLESDLDFLDFLVEAVEVSAAEEEDGPEEMELVRKVWREGVIRPS